MRAFVFTDASLASHARQFVWLTLNTEEPVNASVAGRLAADALPSFFVIDPRDERVVLRSVGSLTVPQLHRLLDEGRAAAGGSPATPADAALFRADRLFGEGKNAEAAVAYGEALAAARPGWPARNRVVESRLLALQAGDDQGRRSPSRGRRSRASTTLRPGSWWRRGASTPPARSP